MKKEYQALYFNILINVIVVFLKLIGGFFFGTYTLIVDAYYTICDFFTDIISLISAKISKRRANKKFPFGYGRIEYITGMIIGILIFLLGLFMIFNSFHHPFTIPNLNVLYIVILIIFLKTLSSNYLFQVGKKKRSQILISSAKESFIDVLSSIMIFLIVLIGQFFNDVDLIGSLIICLLIIGEGVKIISDNVFALMGIDENDKVIKKDIAKIINSTKDILYSDAALIKNGSYYQATIEIAVPNIKVKDLLKKENQLKKEIKRLKYKIKFIDFNIIVK